MAIKIRSKKGLKPIEVNEINQFKSNVEDFWDEVKDNYYWIVARTQDFLNWRYCDPRGGRYRVTSVEENRKLIGYCVSRINNFNIEYPKGIIVDILSLPGREDVTEILLVDALNDFDSQGVNCVHAWAGQKHPFMKTQ